MIKSDILYYSDQYEHMTIDMIVRKYFMLSQNNTSYPEVVLANIKGYMNDAEINVETVSIDVLNHDCKKCDKFIMVNETYIMKTEELTEREMKRPVIDYLIKHNIIRACWTCDGKPFDVWEEYFDLEKEIIGYNKHQDKVCGKNNCDLITYQIYDNFFRLLPIEITNRNEKYKFKYDDTEFEMEVPLICKKTTVIETFLKKQSIKNLLVYDLDLYYVGYKSTKISDSDKFIVKNFVRIGNSHTVYRSYGIEVAREIYVIVRKNVTSCELYEHLNQIPKLISDIIFTYVDFNSNSPRSDDIFKPHQIMN